MHIVHTSNQITARTETAELEIAIARASRPNTQFNNALPTISAWTEQLFNSIDDSEELRKSIKAMVGEMYADQSNKEYSNIKILTLMKEECNNSMARKTGLIKKAIKEEEMQIKNRLKLLFHDQQPRTKRREQRREQRKKSQTLCTNSFK